MASYMAMRRIDDQIDALKPHDRHLNSPGLTEIDLWSSRVSMAAIGEISDEEGPAQATWAMLANTLPNSQFEEVPFLALAQSMRHDAKGLELADWQAFLTYCHGATVAPTAIYLALMRNKKKQVSFQTIWSWAEPLAQFCYLAHILRDLRKDAIEGEHLLTIPNALFADLALDRATLAARLINDDTLLATLSSRLLDHLPPITNVLQEIIKEVMAALTLPSRMILSRLLAHYGGVLQSSASAIGREEFAMPHFISDNQAPI